MNRITCEDIHRLAKDFLASLDDTAHTKKESGFFAYKDKKGKVHVLERCRGDECGVGFASYPGLAGNVSFHTHPVAFHSEPSNIDWKQHLRNQHDVMCVGYGMILEGSTVLQHEGGGESVRKIPPQKGYGNVKCFKAPWWLRKKEPTDVLDIDLGKLHKIKPFCSLSFERGKVR